MIYLLQKILTDWTIIFPDTSCSTFFALSNCRATGITRNGIKQLMGRGKESPSTWWSYWWYLWTFSVLSELNFGAYWRAGISILESQYLQTNEGCSWSIRTTPCRWIDFQKLYQTNRKSDLHSFGTHLLEAHISKKRLMKIVASGDSTKVIPLYVLCYLFDTNELTNAELKNTKEETAQYILHVVVGLVIMNHQNITIIIADPNGALIIDGSNMEFISMPLSKLRSKPTTTCVVSCYVSSSIIIVTV